MQNQLCIHIENTRIEFLTIRASLWKTIVSDSRPCLTTDYPADILFSKIIQFCFNSF